MNDTIKMCSKQPQESVTSKVEIAGLKDNSNNTKPPSPRLEAAEHTRSGEDDCGLGFVDDDIDPDYALASDSGSGSELKHRLPRRKRMRLDVVKGDDFDEQVPYSESDSDFDTELESPSDIDMLLSKLNGGEEEDDECGLGTPKKWNHFIIPLEGALKSLPLRPFKTLWHKLYEDPGFEVSTNGECLLYNIEYFGKTRNINTCMALVHPDTKKNLTTSPQRVILMLACGCYDLPTELFAVTVCFNNRCIALNHISLEPRVLSSPRQQCLVRGKCCRHYNVDTHDYYPDCRPDLNIKSDSSHDNHSPVEEKSEDENIFDDIVNT